MQISEVLHRETFTQSLSAEDENVFLDTAEERDTFVESEQGKNEVKHFCIVPKQFPYTNIRENPAEIRCTYPFKLDRFQELALHCLERDESVLTSAHTSAGKTLIAEYAIHLSMMRKQRVIYTSPIKALSNQKYRELNEKFGDVGLMTGDVTLNPDSTCVVMTTEILRNMIYRGTEMLRETHFVVFDEVHYMRDRERGVVWEEALILLPSTTRFVFLSATIPNAEEFARWIVSIHKQPCHVIYTTKRPTPLEHYIYMNRPTQRRQMLEKGASLPKISDKVTLIIDKEGAFQQKRFSRIQRELSSTKREEHRPRYGRQRESIDITEILTILKRTNNLPTIIFSFRRKDCEHYANIAKREFDFNREEEKEMIETIFTNALNSLREEDRKLDQIIGLKSMLRRGVGVHHSGLLPIVKEIIEILFQENLLKVLFATETVSIGLNMPARSVVFMSIRKFDGISMRYMTSGEYIQMSGRAGRRGTDKIGNVLLVLESSTVITEKEIKKILHGPSNSLDSAFKLTYNTILNILRLDGMDENYIIRHSFLQFRQEMAGRMLYLKECKYRQLLLSMKEDYNNRIKKIEEKKEVLERYFVLKHSLASKPNAFFPDGPPSSLLQPGRVIEIYIPISSKKKIDSEEKEYIQYPDLLKSPKQAIYVILSAKKSDDLQVMSRSGEIEEVGSKYIIRISKTCISIDLNKNISKTVKRFFLDINKKKNEDKLLFYTLNELGTPQEIEKNLECMEEECKDIYNREIEKLPKSELKEVQKCADLFSCMQETEKIAMELKEKKKKTKLIMIEEYKNKKKILHALGYITETETLIKGKVASEISSGDELLLTEMLFNNEFSKLSPGRICSLFSCVVFDEKSDKILLSPESQAAYSILQVTVERLVGEFQRLDTSFCLKEYSEKFCPNLMDIVYSWTEGNSFAHICKKTDVFEGGVIRCFRRLEEVLKEMCRACKLIGNIEMENKFSAAISLVKRDIVFANSLYL